MKLTKPQKKALLILDKHGPLRCSAMAAFMWPDGDSHRNAQNASKVLWNLYREVLTTQDGGLYDVSRAGKEKARELRKGMVPCSDCNGDGVDDCAQTMKTFPCETCEGIGMVAP